MIKSITTFTLSDEIFAVDMQKVPIILKAEDYLPKDISLQQIKSKFKYDQIDVQLLNLYKILKLNPKKITNESRILVGENKGITFGFVVEKVNEIMNVNDNIKRTIPFLENTTYSCCNVIIEIMDQKYLLIDINEVLKYLDTNKSGILNSDEINETY